jgi:predicted ArsR family transcriptional regulator
MGDDLTPREAILTYLLPGPASTAEIADQLRMPERSVRRRLRRLAQEGYVFAPYRGWHRLTTLGRMVIETRP